MQIVNRIWLKLVTWTCGSWSGPWFCLISWRLFDIYTSYFGSMNQYDPMFDLKINVDHCDLYLMVQWVCLIWTSFFFGIMNQYDLTFDLKINVGHCDLYFMVQWFCITSWILFHVWTSVFAIMDKYDRIFDLKINAGHMWPVFHGPVILSYISKTIWYMSVIFSDDETVLPKFWCQSKYKSTWPSGLVILLNIIKIIWWMNIIHM